MNHKKIRPLLKDGASKDDYDEDDIAGYHMTNKRRSRIQPIGYCVDHEPHDTKEEAAQCFEDYTLENHYDEERWQHHQKQRDECIVCGEWGRWVYQPAMYSWLPPVWACEDHKGKATVAEEFEVTPSRETWGSF